MTKFNAHGATGSHAFLSGKVNDNSRGPIWRPNVPLQGMLTLQDVQDKLWGVACIAQQFETI